MIANPRLEREATPTSQRRKRQQPLDKSAMAELRQQGPIAYSRLLSAIIAKRYTKQSPPCAPLSLTDVPFGPVLSRYTAMLPCCHFMPVHRAPPQRDMAAAGWAAGGHDSSQCPLAALTLSYVGPGCDLSCVLCCLSCVTSAETGHDSGEQTRGCRRAREGVPVLK